MTTTLSEGVKVPDVGSVNWAGDLEVNWNLLNGALANLSGNVKLDRDNIWTGEQSFTLPIVGSLTGTASKAIADEDGTSIKSGYVNVAGNQTVTGQKDWTDTNTFSKTNSDTIQLKNGRVAIGETISSDAYTQLVFKDKNTDNLAYIRNNYIANGTNNLDFYVRNKFSNGSPSTTGSVVYTFFGLSLDNTGKSYARLKGDFYPYTNNLYSLGSSSYQWSSVYAQTYYYNGTAWGLDKDNVWSSLNTFQKGIYLAGDRQAYVCPMWSGSSSGLSLLTNSKAVFVGTYTDDASGRKVIDTTKGYIQFHTGTSGTDNIATIEPTNTTNSQLGTSTNKWKTLNGINPGALSLPKVDGWNAGVSIDTTGWDMTSGTWNEFSNSLCAGWVYFAFYNCGVSDRIYARYYGTDARYLTLAFMSSTTGYMYCSFPMAKDSKVNISFTTSGTLMSSYIYPCLGNV